MDSQSSALDDESEAFSKSGEDYIEELRDNLENIEQIVANTMNQVLTNADVVLGTMNTISGEHGITLSEALTLPWQNAQLDANTLQSTVYTVIDAIRLQIETNSPLMQHNLVLPFEEAVGYVQNTFSPEILAALGAVADEALRFNPESDAEDKVDLTQAFIEGENAANTFSANSEASIQNVIDEAKAFTPDGNPEGEKVDFTDPFKDGSEAASSFGNKVENVLKKIVQDVKSYDPTKSLVDPSDSAKASWISLGNKVSDVLGDMKANAINAAKSISTAMSGAVADAREAAAAIQAAYSAANNGGKETGGNKNYNYTPQTVPEVEKQYVVTASVTANSVKFAETGKSINKDVAIGNATSALYKTVIDYMVNKGRMSRDAAVSKWEKTWSKKMSVSTPVKAATPSFAKGTMGTTRDEWAITDEPWLGDELTMYATSQGTLSYMRAGSTVIPADLTKELMAIGEVGLNGLTDMSNAIQGVNLMSNVINKPELNLEFGSLLHIDNCSQDSVKDVEKIVSAQLDKFARNLNYNLKRVGSR